MSQNCLFISCRRFVCLLLVVALFFAPEFSYAQSLFVSQLPKPGMMVYTSPSFTPVLVKGLVIHPDKLLNFDFIVDSGNASAQPTRGHSAPEGGSVSPSTLPSELAMDMKATQGANRRPHQNTIEEETLKMAKYFLAAITVPEKDLWVNLSPYEKDRVIENKLGATVLGRDMLAQDYLLKQLTASLIYPEKGLGKIFWDKIYAAAMEKYGTTDVPVDTFNKVWIMPEKAEVFEKANAVYVTQARLKVLLDTDYVSAGKGSAQGPARTLNGMGVGADPRVRPVPGEQAMASVDASQELAKDILREIIIPALEKEVNEGENFTAIRQIFHAAILAKWYREKVKDTLLASSYVGRNKVDGVATDEKTLKEEIYERYIAAYKKGVFSYIKDDVVGADPRVRPLQDVEPSDMKATQGITRMPYQGEPRQYFSGGEVFSQFDLAQTTDATAIRPPDGTLLDVNISMDAAAVASSGQLSIPFERQADLKQAMDNFAVWWNRDVGEDGIFSYRQSIPVWMPKAHPDSLIMPVSWLKDLLRSAGFSDEGFIEELFHQGVISQEEMVTFERSYAWLTRSDLMSQVSQLRETMTDEHHYVFPASQLNQLLLKLSKGVEINIKLQREDLLREYYYHYMMMRSFIIKIVTALMNTLQAPEYLNQKSVSAVFSLRDQVKGYYFDRYFKIHRAVEKPVTQLFMPEPQLSIEKYFEQDPDEIVHMFMLAARSKAVLAPELQESARFVLEHADSQGSRISLSPKSWEYFEDILRLKTPVAATLVAMHELGFDPRIKGKASGLLGILLPPLAALDGLMGHEIHSFSQSYHSLYFLQFFDLIDPDRVNDPDNPLSLHALSLSGATKVYESLSQHSGRSDYLYVLRLAALLHDSGKSEAFTNVSMPHPATGALYVIPALTQLPLTLNKSTLGLLRWLVRNHQINYLLTTRLKPPASVLDISKTELLGLISSLGKDYLTPDRLDLLYLITVADRFALNAKSINQNVDWARQFSYFYDALQDLLGLEKEAREKEWMQWRIESWINERPRLLEEKFQAWMKSLGGQLVDGFTDVEKKEYILKNSSLDPALLDAMDFKQLFNSVRQIFQEKMHAAFELMAKTYPVIDIYHMPLRLLGTHLRVVQKLQESDLKKPQVVVEWSGQKTELGDLLSFVVGLNQDRMGILARLAGVLSAMGYNIQSSQVTNVPQGQTTFVIDRVDVYTDFGNPDADMQWRHAFEKYGFKGGSSEEMIVWVMKKVLSDEISIEELMMMESAVRQFKRVAPRDDDHVSVLFEQKQGEPTKMVFEAPDRHGLIFLLSMLLSYRFHVNIEGAPLLTPESGARDILYLTKDGLPLNEDIQEQIKALFADIFMREVITYDQVVRLTEGADVKDVFRDELEGNDAAMTGDHDSSTVNRKKPVQEFSDFLPSGASPKKKPETVIKGESKENPYFHPQDTVTISPEAKEKFRQSQEIKKDDTVDHSAATSKLTYLKRNNDVLYFTLEEIFKNKTGVDPRKKNYSYIDVGAGNPPLTTIELKKNLLRVNSRSEVIATELPQAQVLREIVVMPGSKLFEELESRIKRLAYYSKASISKIRFVVTPNGLPKYAGVSEIMANIDKGNGTGQVSHPLAYAPNFRFLLFGAELEEDSLHRNVHLFKDLVKIITKERLEMVQRRLWTFDANWLAFKSKANDFLPAHKDEFYVNPAGMIVIYNKPVYARLNKFGITFKVTEELATIKARYPKIFMINNVVFHVPKGDERQGFYNMLAQAMAEKDIALIKNGDRMSFQFRRVWVNQLDIYQKLNHKFVYLGSVAGVEGESFNDDPEFFNWYADKKSHKNVFSADGEAALKNFNETSQTLNTTISHFDANPLGGIDIKDIHVENTGSVDVKFSNDALRAVLKDGFNGFTPVIHQITPVTDLHALLGVPS